MSAISLKSITGITSITTPAGLDNQLTLHTNNTTERLRIKSDGDVLIGTQTTAGKLTVDTGGNATAGYISVTSGGTGRLKLGYAFTGAPSNDHFAEILTDTNGDLDIATRGNNSSQIKLFTSTGSGSEERLRITASGRVQIANGGDLYVVGSSYNAQLTGNILDFDRAGYSYIQNSSNSGSLNFRVTASNTIALRLDNAAQAIFPEGVLFLGTQNSSSGHLNAYETMTFNIDTDNDDTNRYFAFYKNGASGSGNELLRITEGGKVGIGTVSSLGTVDIYNSGSDASDLNSLGAQINAAWIRIGDVDAAGKTFSNGLGVKFYDQGTVHWSYGVLGSDFLIANTSNDGNKLFPSNRTAPVIIKSDGKVGIGTESPSNALDVQGGTTNTAIVARSTDAKAQISLVDNSTTSVGSVVVGAEGDNLFFTSGSSGAERLRIGSDGTITQNYGNSTSSTVFIISKDGNGEAQLRFDTAASNTASLLLDSAEQLKFRYGSTEVLRIDSAGRIQIGSFTNASYNSFDGPGRLNIQNNSADGTVDFSQGIVFTDNTNNSGTWTHAGIVCTGSSGYNGNLVFGTDGDGTSNNLATNIVERLRIDNKGRLIVGGGSDPAESTIVAKGNSTSATSYSVLDMRRGEAADAVGDVLGYIRFSDTNIPSSNNNYALIYAAVDAASSGQGDNPGRLVFSTTADGASGPTERLRITSTGNLTFSNNQHLLVNQSYTNGSMTIGANTGTSAYTAIKGSDHVRVENYNQNGSAGWLERFRVYNHGYSSQPTREGDSVETKSGAKYYVINGATPLDGSYNSNTYTPLMRCGHSWNGILTIWMIFNGDEYHRGCRQQIIHTQGTYGYASIDTRTVHNQNALGTGMASLEFAYQNAATSGYPNYYFKVRGTWTDGENQPYILWTWKGNNSEYPYAL